MTSAQVSQDIAPLKSFAYDAVGNCWARLCNGQLVGIQAARRHRAVLPHIGNRIGAIEFDLLKAGVRVLTLE